MSCVVVLYLSFPHIARAIISSLNEFARCTCHLNKSFVTCNRDLRRASSIKLPLCLVHSTLAFLSFVPFIPIFKSVLCYTRVCLPCCCVSLVLIVRVFINIWFFPFFSGIKGKNAYESFFYFQAHASAEQSQSNRQRVYPYSVLVWALY